MIAKTKTVQNYEEVIAYKEAIEEYGSEIDAKINGYEKPEEILADSDFMFDIQDVRRAWVQKNAITLDFGGEDICAITKTDEVMNKLKERFE